MHKVEFFFYGKKKNLKKVLEKIKADYSDNLDDFLLDESLIIVLKINEDDLSDWDDFFVELGSDLMVEYDGYGYDLFDAKKNKKKQPKISLKPNDVFAYQTNDGKYIVGVCYGTDKVEYAVNFIKGKYSQEELSSLTLEDKEFIYEQPVIFFNHLHEVKKIDVPFINKEPHKVFYNRMIVGTKHSDYIEKRLGVKRTFEEYRDFVYSLYLKNQYVPVDYFNYIKYEIKKGVLKSYWNDEISPEELNNIQSSYLLYFPSMETVEASINEDHKNDLLTLKNAVYREEE